ncbi:MAG: condensation domain-containing protein [Acidobacteriota bacterium]|nr:condensation domain-containing protein [Acidobacteriota bacterium]
MDTIEDYIHRLEAMDIKLWIEGDRLRLNAPREVITPTLRSELRERKQGIIDYLGRRDDSQLSPITMVPDTDGQARPSSLNQQWVWSLERLRGSNVAYNIPFNFHFKGRLNLPFLEQAFNEVVARHQVLRTTFREQDGHLWQDVAREGTMPPLTCVDYGDRGLTTHSQCIRQLKDRALFHTFDLMKGPLAWYCLIRLAPHEHILLMTIHHIIFDGWSIGVFIGELGRIYTALYHGKPHGLPPLPIQYGDFAAWQQKRLKAEVVKSQIDFWKNKLADAPTIQSLPTDNARPESETFRGDQVSFKVSPSFYRPFHSLCRHLKVTPFVPLLAAYAILLQRYSGQDDLVIGSPLANRRPKEVEPLIGYFSNRLCFRVQFHDAPSFTQLVAQLQKTYLEVFANQDVPLETLATELLPVENRGTPLYQTSFHYHQSPNNLFILPELVLRPLSDKSKIMKFDLSMSLGDTGEFLSGAINYKVDLFEIATIERMARDMTNLLEAIIDDPDRPVAKLSFSGPREK